MSTSYPKCVNSKILNNYSKYHLITISTLILTLTMVSVHSYHTCYICLPSSISTSLWIFNLKRNSVLNSIAIVSRHIRKDKHLLLKLYFPLAIALSMLLLLMGSHYLILNLLLSLSGIGSILIVFITCFWLITWTRIRWSNYSAST